MKKTVKYIAIFVVICVSACAKPPEPSPPHVPTTGSIQLHTSPTGGRILITQARLWINDGGKASLKPGTYHLKAVKDGYRPGETDIDVRLGKNAPAQVLLGSGFGTVTIQSEPVDASVQFNAKAAGVTPLDKDLDEGAYHAVVSANGFVPKQFDFVIKPGAAAVYKIKLAKVIDSALVKLTTLPPGGVVSFKGREYSAAKIDFGYLKFGHYRVHAVKSLDDITRLVGQRDFAVSSGKAMHIELAMKQKQCLFEGQWLPLEQAVKLEAKRYNQQRVNNPVDLMVTLNQQQFASFVANNSLSSDLMAILRVGDRITFKSGNQSWVVWKRNRNLTTAFSANIKALQTSQPQLYSWPADHGKQVEVAGGTISSLAYNLHRNRSSHALLDLNKEQLSSPEQIVRSRSDGVITIVSLGGRSLSIPGGTVTKVGDISLFTVAAANAPIEIRWQGKPTRLLVVSDTPWNMAVHTETSGLQVGEKHTFRLVRSGTHISELIRLSAGPDYSGWERKVLKASGPMMDQLDFTVDEIGPNKLSGHYQRSWIVRYGTGINISQRQVDSQYTVGLESKQVESDRFFRRGEPKVKTAK